MAQQFNFGYSKGADFGDTVMEGQIAPPTDVQRPVDNNAGQYIAKAVDSAAQGIGTVAGDIFKSGADAAGDKVANSYRMGVLNIADAVDQGKLDLTAARTRMRVLYAQTISDNPASADNIDKLNTKLLGDTGIGHIIQTGTDQDQRIVKLGDSAVAAGWVNKDGTPDIDGWTNLQHSVQASTYAIQQLSLRKGNRDEANDLEKNGVHQALVGVAKAAWPWVQHQIDLVQTQLATTADPAQRGLILQKFQDTVNTEIGQVSLGSGGENIDYITKPMQEAAQSVVDGVNGKMPTDAINAQTANIKAKASLSLEMDPDVAKFVAVSDLFGNNASAILEKQGTALSVKLFGNSIQDPNTVGPTPVVSQTKDTTDLINTSTLTMQNTLANPSTKPGDKSVQEVNNNITNILRGLASTKSATPKDYAAALDFFASPTMQKWIASGQLVVPKELQGTATNMLSEQYEQVLVPLVDKTWNSGTVQSYYNTQPLKNNPVTGLVQLANPNKPMNIKDTIDPIWDGNGVTFKPKPEFANDPNVVGAAKGLNQGPNAIAPVMNTLIRAKAAISGESSYGKEWDALGGRIFTPDEGDKGSRDEAVAPTGNLSDLATGLITKDLPEADATQVADSKTTGVLKGFEGYSGTAYWDKDHYRVGFGSDTYTSADGSVHPVTANTTITKDDAERDLQRRVNTEFIPRVIGQIGHDKWQALGAGAQAALTSVAYNYGSLPKTVVAVAQSGDKDLLADAVESLSANPKRRAQEANMIRNG